MRLQHVEGKDRGKIVMYALSTCMWCRMAKSLFQELGIAYDFVDVDHLEGEDKDRAKAEIRKWNPPGNFPTIVIDERECLAGFDEQKIRGRFE
jgi:glutaredoxin-like protein NrdH